MNQIEQLAVELFQLPYFTQQLRFHIHDLTTVSEPSCVLEQQPSLSVQSIVEEITNSLAEIAETGSEEGEIRRLHRQQEAEDEIRRQISRETQEQCARMEENLKQEIKRIQVMVEEQLRDSSRSQPVQQLKLQRKIIARSILEANRLTSPKSFKSSFSPRLEKTKADTMLSVETEDPFADENDVSLPLKSQVTIEKSRNEGSQEREGRMVLETMKNEINKDLETIKEDISRLGEQSKKMKEELNTKFDSNLSSLWNVVSDVSTRLCKIEFT